jgi:hypothetical protein
VVIPWAEVRCGAILLGTTPFKPVQLPAGEYECRFTNPDSRAIKTQRVVVRANETKNVLVKF